MSQGVRAIWSPETGIVDWAEVARHYAKVFTTAGGTVLTDFEAVKFTGDQSEGDNNLPTLISCDFLARGDIITCFKFHSKPLS